MENEEGNAIKNGTQMMGSGKWTILPGGASVTNSEQNCPESGGHRDRLCGPLEYSLWGSCWTPPPSIVCVNSGLVLSEKQ